MSEAMLSKITPEQRFDAAFSAAEGWRHDARLYVGRRRSWRLRRAESMERIAAQIVEGV